MAQIETTYRSMPVARGGGVRSSTSRQPPRPEFLSQLLDDRETLAAQRNRRQATALEVLRGYDAGGRLKVLRMPPGYLVDRDA